MAIMQSRSRRKRSGGRYVDWKIKRASESGNLPTLTKIGEHKSKTVRTLGGNLKHRLLDASIANIYDPSTKKFIKGTIKTVVENPANRHYARRNILTKGTVVDTDKGKAKITNRPGQENIINAILMAEKKSK